MGFVQTGVVGTVRFQLFLQVGGPSFTQNGFPVKTILNLKRAWGHIFWATPTKLGKFVTFWEMYKSYYYHFWKFLTVSKLKKMLEPSSPGLQSFLSYTNFNSTRLAQSCTFYGVVCILSIIVHFQEVEAFWARMEFFMCMFQSIFLLSTF